MEFLLNFLLNYITLSVAGIAFVLILVVLIWKRKTLSGKDKALLIILLALWELAHRRDGLIRM